MMSSLSAYAPCRIFNRSKAIEEDWQLRIFNSFDQVPEDIWNGLLPKEEPLLMGKYLRSFEAGMKEKIQTRYVLFEKDGQVLGLAFFCMMEISGKAIKRQPKNADEGRIRSQFGRILLAQLKRMSMRLLLNGNPFLTGSYGFYFTHQIKAQWELLAEAADQIIKLEDKAGNKIDSVVFKDLESESKSNHLEEFCSYKQVEFQPHMIFYLKPEWKSFEDYMQSISSKYRVRARKAFKKGEGLAARNLTAKEVDVYAPKMYEMYRELADKASFNLAYAGPSYFQDCLKALPEHFNIRGYFIDDQLMGFISYFEMGNRIDCHFIGYHSELNIEKLLYQNILYNMVELSIERGVEELSFGRTATEIKSSIGASGIPLVNLMMHRNPITNRLLGTFFQSLSPQNWTLRNPFKKPGTKS